MVTKKLFLDNFIIFSSSLVRKECFDTFGLFVYFFHDSLPSFFVHAATKAATEGRESRFPLEKAGSKRDDVEMNL